MAGASTLDEIEADLRFCEDVLNSNGKVDLSRGRQRPGSAALAGPSQPLAGPPRQQLHMPQKQPAPPLKQAVMPPTARTTEELLHMLSSVPAGQPFEIDTRLLYSPQSSSDGEAAGHDSPVGSRSGRGASIDGGSTSGAHFSLPAYRGSTDGFQPLYADLGQAASALGPLPGNPASHQRRQQQPNALLSPTGDPWRSQQHAAGPLASTQQRHSQQQWQQQGRQVGSRGSQYGEQSPAGSFGGRSSARPTSAPLRGGGVAGGTSTQPRQLLLDDYAERGVQGRTADLLRQGRDNRLERLAQPRTGLWQRCAEIKVLEEQEQLQECTFAPRTGRAPTQQRVVLGMPVEDRLQLAQAGRQEALQRARIEKEREALADCTFAPRLVTQPERHMRGEHTPLHRRLGEEQRRRSTRLAQAQLRQGLAEADLTFQPQLNQRSLQMAADRQERELYEDPLQQRRPGSAPRSASRGSNGGADAAFTFSPAINRASERLMEDSATVPADFQERLRYYSMRRAANERAASAAADADACTFRPDTGNAVQVLALSATRAGNLLENERERYERMAGEEGDRLAAKRAAKEAEVYGGMDFRPQLNRRSLAMAPAGSGGLDALASADKRQRKLEELRRVAEEQRRAECTFQPDTSKPRVKGYYDEYQPPAANAVISIANAAKQGFEGLTQKIADYQLEREARSAAVRAEEEAKKLKECSFAPDINRRRVEAKGPVVVRGLERTLELKQLAERQRAAAEERAVRVFNLNPRANQGATVPKPFQLAGHALLEAKAAEKQTARLESALAERARECPFRPQTNHQRRQEQLQRLLAQPSPEGSDVAGMYLV